MVLCCCRCQAVRDRARGATGWTLWCDFLAGLMPYRKFFALLNDAKSQIPRPPREFAFDGLFTTRALNIVMVTAAVEI